MTKIVAEEIEIIVTARVEEALREFKKMLPEIKKQMEQAQEEFNKVDMKSIAGKTQNVVQQVKQKIGEIKGANTNKTLQTQFEKASTSVMNYRQQLEQTREQLRQVYAQMDVKQEKTWKQYTPDGVALGNKGIEPTVNKALGTDKEYQNLIVQETKLNQKIQELNQKLQQAKQNYQNIGAEVQQTQSKQNIFTSIAGKVNNVLQTIKLKAGGIGTSFNKMPSITAKVTANIKQMSSGVKQGLGHILKYAGALFSLRGIYSILSSSASSWLSSQNAGAQQLKSNIDYMKYAMGSALAPVIQFVTNLMYQLLKAVQSVVYALFKVNIFAKASSKSYASMAGSAKKAKDESKQLAGVHDEINNIQNNDNSDSGSGSSAPSFDLSKVDPRSSIMDAIANGDWYGVGVLLGEKLNQVMASIPWDNIQNTTRQIGTNIANLLNGFIATVDWYQVGNTFAQGLNTVIYFAYSFITTFNWKQFGTAIAKSINGFFDNVDWGALAQTLSAGLKGIFDTATGFFMTLDWGIIIDSIIEFFTNVDYSGISDAFFGMLGSAAGSLVNLGLVIGEKINEAIDFAKEYFSSKIEECGGNIVEGIFKGIIDALIGIGDWVIEHIFTPFIEGFKNVFGIHSPSTVMAEMGRYIIEGLYNGIISLVDTIREIWDNMKAKIEEIWNSVKEFVINLWNTIKTNGQNIWENIKSIVITKITTLKTNISSVLNNIKTTWTTIWTSLKTTVINIWNGIWSGIKGVINKILGGIEGFANGIVRGVNTALDALDGIVTAVGSVIGIDIHVPKLNEISLPRLATGNVAYNETLAIFGEYAGASNNPEITAPQNIIRETVEEALANAGGSNQPINLTVKVGDKKLGSIMLEDLRNLKRQTGKDIEAIVGG